MAFITRENLEKIIYTAAGVIFFVAVNRFIVAKYLSQSNWLFFLVGASLMLVFTDNIGNVLNMVTSRFVKQKLIEQLVTAIAGVVFFVSFNTYVIDKYLADIASWMFIALAVCLFLFRRPLINKLLGEKWFR